MTEPLLVVDVQNGFVNSFTQHISARIVSLIERGDHDPVLFTRFVNPEGSPFRRLLGWDGCSEPPDTEITDNLLPFTSQETVFSKSGYAGLPDPLANYLVSTGTPRISLVGIDTDMCVLKVAMDLFDLNIEPRIYIDCCASTAGLQSHLAGLAVLARNIGSDHLLDAGLGDGRLAAPPVDSWDQ